MTGNRGGGHEKKQSKKIIRITETTQPLGPEIAATDVIIIT